jgi:hypothetical protein
MDMHLSTTVEPEIQGKFLPSMQGRPPQIIEEVNGWVKIYEDVMPFCEYVIGVDNSRGNDDGDFQSAIVMKRNPGTIVAEIHGRDFNRVKPTQFAHQIYYCALRYNYAWVNLEANYGEVTNGVIGTASRSARTRINMAGGTTLRSESSLRDWLRNGWRCLVASAWRQRNSITNLLMLRISRPNRSTTSS